VTHPLDDCRLKIARAKEQFDALHQEISDFAKNNSDVFNIYVDTETGDEVLDCTEPPVFPRNWGIKVGELAHNLRSALDYLVNVLSAEGGGKPEGNHFPIARTKGAYLRKDKRGRTMRAKAMPTVPETMRRRIDAYQPYTHGKLAYADALVALQHLTNQDKHNRLVPAYMYVTTPRQSFSFPCEEPIANFEIRMPRDGGFSVKAQFKGGRVLDRQIIMYPNVKMQRPTGVEVVFGRDPAKLVGLDDIRRVIVYVELIIESFCGDMES
jgi:hypothetical protein